MRAAVEAILVVDAALGVLTWILARNLHPRLATVVLAGVAVVIATTSAAAVAVMAADPLGALLVAAKLHRLPTGLGTASPIPDRFEAAAGMALVVMATSGAYALWRQLGAARSSHRLRRACDNGSPLVVVDTDRAIAFALPGIRPRIVVSRALVQALDAGERSALLAHERAHLRHHHRTYQAVTDLAAGLCPPLVPYRRRVDMAVERWADESAAGHVGDRRLVARSLSRAGLLTLRAPPGPAAGLSFGTTLVAARVRALLASPPRVRWWPVVGPVLLAGVAVALAAVASHDFELLVELALRLHLRGG